MQRFQEILALVPADTEAHGVVLRAAELAERNHARLTIFDVVPPANPKRRHVEHAGVSIDLDQIAIDTRRRQLDELASKVLTADVRVHVAVGVRFVAVIEKVLRDGHDLVVTAPDRPTTRRGLAGATDTMHLLRKCPCPVWVDDPATWSRSDVMVAVGPVAEYDEAPGLNRTLLELATSLARIRGGSLHTVHAWRLEGEHLLRRGRFKLPSSAVDAMVEEERAATESAVAELLSGFELDGLDHHLHLRMGPSAEVIGAVADEVQPGVLVMGTLARSGLQGWLIGNTAERVLGGLQASVLAVKPSDFVSPIRPL
jgi:universal stress protein E